MIYIILAITIYIYFLKNILLYIKNLIFIINILFFSFNISN